MNRDPMNSAFDMYRMMAAAAEAFTKYPWDNTADPASASVDAAKRVQQLYMAFANSGFRYLARWAEISVKRYPEFTKLSSTMNARRAITGPYTDDCRRHFSSAPRSHLLNTIVVRTRPQTERASPTTGSRTPAASKTSTPC